MRCKERYVLTTWRGRFPVCFECQKKELEGEIKDPKMKKFFNLPEEFYKENAFLRDIKVNYLRYGGLSNPQIEAFKKAAKQMKEERKKA